MGAQLFSKTIDAVHEKGFTSGLGSAILISEDKNRKGVQGTMYLRKPGEHKSSCGRSNGEVKITKLAVAPVEPQSVVHEQYTEDRVSPEGSCERCGTENDLHPIKVWWQRRILFGGYEDVFGAVCRVCVTEVRSESSGRKVLHTQTTKLNFS